MKHLPVGSEYIEEQRKQYSLYVIQTRAIPNIADGMIFAMRRLLWTANNFKEIKTSSLAGNTLALHPHSPPEDTINHMASEWMNQYPLFQGHGAFGTLLSPDSFAAGRYTSVEISQFTKDVIFSDLDIIPLVDNYDNTLTEPQFFLPLVPLCLINPSQGIAVGFATNILPRKLSEVIELQLRYLQGENIDDCILVPYFKPTDSRAVERLEDTARGNHRWRFEGEYVVKNSTDVVITKLPYGTTYSKYISYLSKLVEQDKINDFIDNSRDEINIIVKFPRGTVNEKTPDELVKFLGLSNNESENLTVLDFDGEGVLNITCGALIRMFTQWRLGWYTKRYQVLLDALEENIQKYQDILTAINNNVGSIAREIKNKQELITYLTSINIVNIDYIASLPVYRFTEDEKNKVEKNLKEALKQRKSYIKILNDEQLRISIYIDELKFISDKYNI